MRIKYEHKYYKNSQAVASINTTLKIKNVRENHEQQ